VILTRDGEAVWLDSAIQDPTGLLPLLKSYSPEEMEFYPVSTWVNNLAHDSSVCVEAAAVVS
jgi:putative SOS response-associated peptidase YedK